MDSYQFNSVDYVAPSVMQETIPVDKAVVETLCKD